MGSGGWCPLTFGTLIQIKGAPSLQMIVLHVLFAVSKAILICCNDVAS